MGWWPFKRRVKPMIDNPHMKGARTWISDLREMCERHFDNPPEGQRRLQQMQIEWKDALKNSEIADELYEGLERRAYRLLRADAEEWLGWLDDDEFWKPGWRPPVEEE